MNHDAYERARKRVKKKKDFYSHLATYLAMGAFFLALNLVTAPGRWWFFWPMLGWGIGLAFHYLDAFGLPGVGTLDKDWEQKAIEEEMERMHGRSRDESEALPPADQLDLPELKREKEKARKWDESDLV